MKHGVPLKKTGGGQFPGNKKEGILKRVSKSDGG